MKQQLVVTHRYTILEDTENLDKYLAKLSFYGMQGNPVFFCAQNFDRRCVCNPPIYECGILKLTNYVSYDKLRFLERFVYIHKITPRSEDFLDKTSNCSAIQ
jgi:hypothetical protein